MDLGPAELLIVLAIVMLLFGSSRIADLGGSLGRGIREFKKGIEEDEPIEQNPLFAATATLAQAEPAPAAPAQLVEAPVVEAAVMASGAQACASCGTVNSVSAVFCGECGSSLRPQSEN